MSNADAADDLFVLCSKVAAVSRWNADRHSGSTESSPVDVETRVRLITPDRPITMNESPVL